jgi:hypothetical protein
LIRHGEAASASKEGEAKFKTTFAELIEEEGCLPQQVLSVDEIGLFWNKVPRRMYINKDEVALPGHKPLKDRLTLLFGFNGSGYFKLKPLFLVA